MGGGDLNLKKSWHPQTMKNIERVWKAEQKHEAEVKKIEELQKELKDERAREEITKFAQETGALKKKDDRLDWMYQGPAGQVSRDEYLMGRPIDKQITEQFEEPESGPSTQTGLLPGSIFNPTTPASTLDLQAKIREDPLFEIRKREEEKKREVLTNPVKMKKIKAMLRENLEMEKKKKKKKDKKERRADKERKKEKKHKRRTTSSSSEEEEVHRKHGSHSKKEKSRHTDRPNSQNIPGYGLLLPASGPHQPPAPSSQPGRRERSRSRSPKRNGTENHSSHHHSDSKVYRRPASPQKERYQRQKSHRSKQLSAEELENKRLEMMGFAKQRDEERMDNVKRYKKQEEQEKEQEQSVKHVRHAGFIHNMKLESAATSSLEDRVKRNIHSIQRTKVSLEKNFMRR
ncbi:pre-mRNA-splicing factor CWC25 homolog [Gadus morhua]|uniref:CBF1-interacting co-repressor CIR N-terminal domain-containing protein n=1 Tax=Gadus morhua TaxID=8049 RepID=A0A8C4ZH74_GADMO|nr:pre-mRNA-splicing factor CWC25 homolog [Gadus morhua]